MTDPREQALRPTVDDLKRQRDGHLWAMPSVHRRIWRPSEWLVERGGSGSPGAGGPRSGSVGAWQCGHRSAGQTEGGQAHGQRRHSRPSSVRATLPHRATPARTASTGCTSAQPCSGSHRLIP